MKKILVVDDDTDILEVMEYVLEKSRYDLVISDRRPTINKVIEENPSLILLDYFLGESDGKEFCLSLKQHPKTKNIPVIIMSAHDNVEMLARESCADAYIAKPFDIDIFEKLIDQTSLNKKR